MPRSTTPKKKGAPKRLEISRIGAQGDGISHGADGDIYVPFTAAGDVVDVWLEPGLRGTMRASLEAIVAPGADRAEPSCRHFGSCGGCSLQHLTADAYAGFVRDRVKTALSQHGLGDVPIEAPHISPPGSRRRLALKALRTSRGVLLGFNQRQSHHLVDVKECPIARPALVALLKPLRAVLGDLLTLRAGLDITLTDSDSGIDLLISGRVSLDLARREALATFAESHDLASVHVLDDGFLDPVSVRRAPKMRFGEVEAPLPPGGFVQATKEGEMALLEAILEWTAGVTHCADLFAGIGTFSLPLARHSTVHAVEGARSAVEALRKAVHGTQSLKQVTLDHRDLFRRPLAAHELNRFGSVIIDPPRAGAAAQMTELARSAVPAVIAVSCNPNTFARDARLLVDGGYDLVCVRPVDQFLWSPHVELVARFLKTA